MRILRILYAILPANFLPAANALASDVQTPASSERSMVRPDSCESDDRLDPYEVWQDVRRSRRKSREFAFEQYNRLETPERLAQWLACQGFKVLITSYGSQKTSSNLSKRVVGVIPVANAGNPALFTSRIGEYFNNKTGVQIIRYDFDDRNRIIDFSVEPPRK